MENCKEHNQNQKKSSLRKNPKKAVYKDEKNKRKCPEKKHEDIPHSKDNHTIRKKKANKKAK